MNQELGIRNYGWRPWLRRDGGKASRYLNSLIHYSLFIIPVAALLATAPAQATGACVERFNDAQGPCTVRCLNVLDESSCQSPNPETWVASGLCGAGDLRACVLPGRTTQQGLLPVPGASCDKLSGAERRECRQSICAKDFICNYGVCTFGVEDRAATDPEVTAPSALPCNYTLDDIVQTGVNFANILFGITGSLMLVFIFYGGYQMLTSMGNAEEIQKARKTLTAAFIGLMIVFGATILIRFVGELIGAQFKEAPRSGLGETVIPPAP